MGVDDAMACCKYFFCSDLIFVVPISCKILPIKPLAPTETGVKELLTLPAVRKYLEVSFSKDNCQLDFWAINLDK